MADNLVVYFSATGTTRKVAEDLAQVLGADLFEIKPQTPYTEADLNWKDDTSRSSVEMGEYIRPEIVDAKLDLSKYSTIFLGYPIWWGVAPMAVNAFLECNDFAGKTIVPFATSGSSGVGDPQSYLSKYVPAAATITSGETLNNAPTKDALAAWVKRLGLAN